MKALEMAAKFYNTPKSKVYDNKGHALFEIENNLGNVSKDIFVSIVDGGITSEEIWQALLDAEYLTSSYYSYSIDIPYLKISTLHKRVSIAVA